ncbi:hypothetical protein CsSME_00031722 [Camellia sinensis var. sinensis]
MKENMFLHISSRKQNVELLISVKLNGYHFAKIMTSAVDMKDESRGRPIQEAKIEILLGKTEKFDELMAATTAERELREGEEQS